MIPYLFIGNGWEASLAIISDEPDFMPSLVITQSYPGNPVIKICQNHSIDLLVIKSIDDILTTSVINAIKERNIKIAFVASFKKIPAAFIELFKYGIYNIHPSYLPQYRGPAPVQWALINAEAITGVTLFKITGEIDKGPIFRQIYVPILEDDNYIALTQRLFNCGKHLIKELILSINTGVNINEILTPQPSLPHLKKAPKIPQEHYRISVRNMREKAYLFFRALFPEAYFEITSGETTLKIKIHDYSLDKIDGGIPAGTITTDGKNELRFCLTPFCLLIKKIQREGKKVMSVDEFLRGFRNMDKFHII